MPRYIYWVATAQGEQTEQRILMFIFPDREITGNLRKIIKSKFLHREFTYLQHRDIFEAVKLNKLSWLWWHVATIFWRTFLSRGNPRMEWNFCNMPLLLCLQFREDYSYYISVSKSSGINVTFWGRKKGENPATLILFW